VVAGEVVDFLEVLLGHVLILLARVLVVAVGLPHSVFAQPPLEFWLSEVVEEVIRVDKLIPR
jgi:hypothetical protein